MRLLSGGALFLSAALLFWIEPMVARLLLPKFGGAPAVWNTCLVFYQTGILAGYAYVHLATRLVGQRLVILGQLLLWVGPLLLLPIGIDASWVPPPGANPSWPLLGLLLASVGLPFFALATSAPLFQVWYARTQPGRNPYILYSASNAGSMLALLAYPTLIEPWLSLTAQGWVWACGYGLFLILATTCACLARRSAGESLQSSEPPPAVARAGSETDSATISLRTGFYWLACSFIPSSMLLGVTTYMTTDIAPIPLLWIVPLALYLFSFILVFGNVWPWLGRPLIWLLPLLLVGQALTTVGSGIDLRYAIPLHLTTFFVVCMVCHGELVRTRPPTRQLTRFYLYLSLGGMLGGLFNALVAPLVFYSLVEYLLSQIGAALLLPVAQLSRGLAGKRGRSSTARAASRSRRRSSACPPREKPSWAARLQIGHRTPALVLALLVAVVLLYKERQSHSYGFDLHRERTFFGVLRVVQLFDSPSHLLSNGYTCHGGQNYEGDLDARRSPLMYYYPNGPIGQLFLAYLEHDWQRVGVVGLGVGSLAAYAEPGQEFTFFEINPAVARIATNTEFFTLLDDADDRHVAIHIVLGDGRRSLETTGSPDFNLLVIDAFSGDAIPVHLLTAEAVRTYFRRLVPGGLVVFNITNQYLDLEPVLGNIAAHAGLVGLTQRDDVLLPQDAAHGKAPSDWVVLARNAEDLEPLARLPAWKPIARAPRQRVWTDDYSNVLSVFRR